MERKCISAAESFTRLYSVLNTSPASVHAGGGGGVKGHSNSSNIYEP